MARLDDDGQWIVMMGFLVAVSIFFLALVINQATLVGQTTAEGVLEFPKSDIRDFTEEVHTLVDTGDVYNSTINETLRRDIIALEEARKNTIVNYSVQQVDISGKTYNETIYHFNNGVTVYDATVHY
ncbi:MAG: hypothetical protein PWP08_124 [Methanofollis sp.]|nr:hypothetical protein [Methanofollis sp.]